jgi:hypothetical protein
MMADEQPNTPSQDAQAPDVGSPEPSTSDEPKEGSSPGWWQRLFNRQPAQEAGPDDGGEQATPGGASKQLTLSEEELQRRVQAEADRRDYDRQQRQKAERKRELREKDPWAYAEEDRKEEQLASQSEGVQQFFMQIGGAHDRAAIDPIVEALPKAERERIFALEGAGHGLEGRKLVVAESLKALEKHWKAEGEKQAEARLRRNQAFRKQVLSEARGGIAEPELLPAASGAAADKQMSDIFRDYYGIGKG